MTRDQGWANLPTPSSSFYEGAGAGPEMIDLAIRIANEAIDEAPRTQGRETSAAIVIERGRVDLAEAGTDAVEDAVDGPPVACAAARARGVRARHLPVMAEHNAIAAKGPGDAFKDPGARVGRGCGAHCRRLGDGVDHVGRLGGSCRAGRGDGRRAGGGCRQVSRQFSMLANETGSGDCFGDRAGHSLALIDCMGHGRQVPGHNNSGGDCRNRGREVACCLVVSKSSLTEAAKG